MKDDLRIKMEVEVKRASPTAFRAFSVHLFDYFIFLLLFTGLLFLTQPLLSKAKPCQDAWDKRETIQVESGLYVKNNDRLVSVADKYVSSEQAYSVTINDLSAILDNYFINFFTQGEWDKAAATYHAKLLESKAKDGKAMFTSDYQRALTNPDYDSEYASLYISLTKDYAPGFLNYKKGYSDYRSTIVRFFFYAIEISFAASYLVIFLLFPLVFHKGKQTLGMKLSRVYLVDAKAISPKVGKYLGYRLFHYVFFVVIGPFAALIPFFISAAMLFIRKQRQTLFEYVFGYFPIEAKSDEVYENEQDAIDAN